MLLPLRSSLSKWMKFPECSAEYSQRLFISSLMFPFSFIKIVISLFSQYDWCKLWNISYRRWIIATINKTVTEEYDCMNVSWFILQASNCQGIWLWTIGRANWNCLYCFVHFYGSESRSQSWKATIQINKHVSSIWIEVIFALQ